MDIVGLYLFIVGLFMGSFYNVVAERRSLNQSIIKPGSHCENCKHRLTWYELIPVFSYLFLKGKCSKCKIKLPKQYLLSELGTGLLFLIAYLIFGFSYKTLILIVLFSASIITFITDIKYYIILDEVIYTSIILILIIYLIFDLKNILIHIISGFILFIVMLLIKLIGDKVFKTESLGWGDVKLSIIAGLVLGYKLGLLYIFIGSFIALPFALISSFKNKNDIIAFGPFLILSILIIYTNLDFFAGMMKTLMGV